MACARAPQSHTPVIGGVVVMCCCCCCPRILLPAIIAAAPPPSHRSPRLALIMPSVPLAAREVPHWLKAREVTAPTARAFVDSGALATRSPPSLVLMHTRPVEVTDTPRMEADTLSKPPHTSRYSLDIKGVRGG